MRTLRWVGVGAALGLALAACTVKLGDGLKYTCTADKDCAGDGYVCTSKTKTGWCCKPTNNGVEACDKIDNDCDGLVDNSGKSEVCNGVDDDCNGKIDEGFDLRNDVANCGACNHQCADNNDCLNGQCVLRTESDCNDGQDNDGNGKADCADSSCNNASCGEGCACKNLGKAEIHCDDTVDNDGDGNADCNDSDCDGQICGAGCQCTTGGAKKETTCFDALDNDGDGKTDCDDSDCTGKFCTDAPLFFTCTAANVCNCNGGAQVLESNNAVCSDDVDNDCDGVKDCADPHCDQKGCTSNSATDCVCKNGLKTEGNCANQADDDKDGKADCADSDCDGKVCTKSGGGGGICSNANCQ